MNAYSINRDGDRIICVEMSQAEAIELQRTVIAWWRHDSKTATADRLRVKDRVYDALTSLFRRERIEGGLYV